MNKLELWSYLESIYGVKVASINTQNILGAWCRDRPVSLAGG